MYGFSDRFLGLKAFEVWADFERSISSLKLFPKYTYLFLVLPPPILISDFSIL